MTDALASARSATLLSSEFPEIARDVPWMPLATVPTAIEPCDLEPLVPRPACDGRIWMKRDDRISPIFGGNKVRRYEYLLADAKARGARRLVTVGGLASTQVMATALFGRELGFEVEPVLFDQPLTAFVREALLTVGSAGARPVYGGGYVATALKTIATLRRGARPYFILPGASNPMANLGYVDAAFELAAQVERGEMPRPDLIVLPTGSGGTLAGLALGMAMLGWSTRVVGVRITELVACNRLTIRWLVEATARFLARRAPRFRRRALGRIRFSLHHGAIGRGYGHPTPDAIRAIPIVERLTGAPGECTYSGKGLVGLAAIARSAPDATILYWHTLSSVRRDVAAVDPATLGPQLARILEGDAVA